MSQFVQGTGLPKHVKVLITGPTSVGKTHSGLELPGPTAVWPTEDGLNGFEDRFDFFSSYVDGVKDLIAKMKLVLANKDGDLDRFRTFMLDSVTVPYQEAVRAYSNSKGMIDFKNQHQFQSDWKELMALIMKLGAKGKNVWATAHAKHQWDTSGPKPVIVDVKPDMADRLGFAFDIIIYVDIIDGVRVAHGLKSRFPQVIKRGDTIENFSVSTHFAPIFGNEFRKEKGIYVPVTAEVASQTVETTLEGLAAASQSQEQSDAQDAREELLSALKALGSQSKGGVIPDDLARRAYAHSKNEASPEDAEATLNEVLALVGGNIREALIKKLKALGSISKGGVVPDELARRAYAIGQGAETTIDAWNVLGELRKIKPASSAA